MIKNLLEKIGAMIRKGESFVDRPAVLFA